MSPLKLTDDELDAVLAAARPLDHMSPDQIGPGTLHRTIAELQRRFWSAPDLSRRVGFPDLASLWDPGAKRKRGTSRSR